MPKSIPTIEGSGGASIARNLKYLLCGQGVYFTTRFLYIVIMARVLGPQAYGMISYGIAWYVLFLPLTRMGMEVVLSRDVGKDRKEGDHTATVTLALQIVSIIVVTIAYIIISILCESDPASRLMVLVFAFALIGRSLALWTGSVYIAYECNQYSFRQQTIFRSLEVILGLAVIFIWREALPVVAIHGLVWCLEAIYGLTIVNRHVLPLKFKAKLADINHVFMQGFPLGASLLLMTLTSQGPLIFFRHMVFSSDILGQLALAMQAFLTLSNLPLALGSVSLPVLSRSAYRKDGKDQVYAETIIRFSILLGVLIALLGTAFGPWLIIKVFGVRYARAGALIGPVLWLIIPFTARQALTGVLVAGKKDFKIFLGAFLGAVFFVTIISEAVWKYNAVGAIISSAAAMSLTVFCFIFLLRRDMAIDMRLALLKPGLAAVSAIVVFYVFSFVGPIVSIGGSLVVLSAMCYWLKCLTSQDITWLRHSFSWIGRN